MRLKIYYCHNEKYSKVFLDATFSHKLLQIDANKKMEVVYDFDPRISGHSDGRFNVMFKDEDESQEEDNRKYFAHITRMQKNKIKWSYGDHIIQKKFWVLVGFIVATTIAIFRLI